MPSGVWLAGFWALHTPRLSEPHECPFWLPPEGLVQPLPLTASFTHSLLSVWSPGSPSGVVPRLGEQDDGGKRQNSRVTGCMRDRPGEGSSPVQSPSPHHHVRQGNPPAWLGLPHPSCSWCWCTQEPACPPAFLSAAVHWPEGASALRTGSLLPTTSPSRPSPMPRTVLPALGDCTFLQLLEFSLC